MSLLAAIRPDDWNLPLFLHVLSAMVMVGGTLAAASCLVFARGDAGLLRLGYRSLLAVAFPAHLAMFASAHWIYAKEGLDEGPIDSAWVAIGFVVAEAGGLLLLVALVAGAIGLRRLRSGGGTRPLSVSMTISVLLLAAYVVAVWAMAAKPD